MPATVSITGVEILAKGTWNGVPIARRDLEEMVTAFNETRDALPVTIRLGHDARQAFARALFGTLGNKVADAAAKDAQGWPAFGEPTRLYLRGDTLLADLANVPDVLAGWIKAKRYRTRSGGLRFNRSVGGKVYRWMLDHIALLGADTPAVDGLADIGLSDDDTDRAVEFSYKASDADGLVALGDAEVSAETALDGFVAALKALVDEYSPLIYNRAGAPRVRQLFAAFTDDLRRVARADVPLHDQEGRMTKWSLPEVRAILNLRDDDPTIRVVEALNALPEVDAVRLVNLADGMGFDSPEQLVGWLAGALGVAPGDLAGIAAKVVEMMGGEAPEVPEGTPPDPAAPPPAGGPNMHDTNPPASPSPAPDLSARVVELSSRNVDLAARVIALETAARQKDAEAKVAGDAARLGLALPVPVRETLVELAAAGNTRAYDSIIVNVKGVPTGEKGTSTPHPLAEIELNEHEIRFAAMQGVSLDDVRRTKAKTAGIVLAG